VQLFVEADVDVTSVANTGVDNRRWVGRDVYLRAVLHDGAPVTGGTVVAEITHPDGLVDTRSLVDDGLHRDGAADDGVYGAVIRNASSAGIYSVTVAASGVGAVVGEFQREGQTAFELHEAPDGDEDGVPDFADPTPTVSDADGDPDGDDLTNIEEFEAHTDPLNADTDGGGEGDGSEVASGKDPLDPADDEITPVMVFAVPCADSAELHLETPVEYARVEIQQGPDFTGPFATIYDGAMPAGGIIAVSAVPDVEVCYRARVAETVQVSEAVNDTDALHNNNVCVAE
jgi:hypothetical protein